MLLPLPPNFSRQSFQFWLPTFMLCWNILVVAQVMFSNKAKLPIEHLEGHPSCSSI